MFVNAAFKDAWQRFEAAQIDTAKLDARILLGHVLGGGAERVLAESGRDLSASEAKTFSAFVQRREAFEPISQILGHKEFWSLDFKVTSATLTPRPDTETLIEAALDNVVQAPIRVLDLGTGTGCILLTLLNEWTDTVGIGVDASSDALSVAQENAKILGLAPRSQFIKADWRTPNWDQGLGGLFEVVVSNPPYIPDSDIKTLEADVRDYEPLSALAGGVDGLDAYREIIAQLPKVLSPNGLIIFEVGIFQALDVEGLLKDAGFEGVKSHFDLSSVARVVLGRQLSP